MSFVFLINNYRFSKSGQDVEIYTDLIQNIHRFKSIETNDILTLAGEKYLLLIPSCLCEKCKLIFKELFQQNYAHLLHVITMCNSNAMLNVFIKGTEKNNRIKIYVCRDVTLLNSQLFSHGVVIFRVNNGECNKIQLNKPHDYERLQKLMADL